MKYAFMHSHRREFSCKATSRVLQVSRSGFYAWCQRQTRSCARGERRARIDSAVNAAFHTRKGRCGAPRLSHDLAAEGSPCNRKTVASSLRRQGLRAKAARKFKATTNSKHHLPVAENLLAQDFSASAPNQKWSGDITYLWTDEGWLYLAVVIDLYSRRVVGWAMSERMSAKGNCYDNACAESFFHSLKVEVIHGERFTMREQMRQTVFEYIETEYNRDRRHSANGYISPEAFEAQHVA